MRKVLTKTRAGVIAGTVAIAAVLGAAGAAHAAPAELTELHQLSPSDGSRAGYSTAMSGKYIAYTDVWGASVAVSVATDDTLTQWETTRVTAANPPAAFGKRVALNEDATKLSVAGAGVVVQFTRNSLNDWTESSRYTAPADTSRVTRIAESFGEALAASGDLIVVGASNATVDGHANTGLAYVIDSSNGTTRELLPTEIRPGSITGQTVAISGEHIAVSAVQNTDDLLRRVGGVYLWDVSAPVGTEPGFATQPVDDATVCLPSGGGGPAFGFALAFQGESLFVGSPVEANFTGPKTDPEHGCNRSSIQSGTTTQGALYQLDRSLTQQGAKLLPPQHSENFGSSIAVSGETILANAEVRPAAQGEVHVYSTGDFTATTEATIAPEPVQTLRASDATDRVQFGYTHYDSAIRATADAVAIGAPFARSKAGSVYVFGPPATVSSDPVVTAIDAESSYGAQHTLTVSVTDQNSEGIVSFASGGEDWGSAPVVNGAAELVLDAPLTAGDHVFSASYSEDAGVTVLAEATATLAILQAATTTTLTTDTTPSQGSPASEARVEGSVAGVNGTIPAGNVVIADSAGQALATLPLDPAGAYAGELPTPAQDMSITAKFGGDVNHQESASQPVSLPAAPLKKPNPVTPPPTAPTTPTSPTSPATPPASSQTQQTATSPRLAQTGGNGTWLLAAAGAALLGGGGAFLGRRFIRDRKAAGRRYPE
ncbi:LPXTG-motif cell wall-anchored protein [Leucobacter luti]|nr:LPXTG-motif cell wall-anchored protein [Leucobacter luti]